MKKALKSIIPLLGTVIGLSSCSSYNAKPGKMKNCVGTYELSIYNMRKEESDSETYDRKAEIGAQAYFCFTEEGYGYYGYKDNSTPAHVSQIFARFKYDSDKPNLVEAVTITDGITHKYANEQFVGCLDESPMGFRDELFKKTLSYTLHSGHMLFQPDKIIKYQYVCYKRIDKSGSLDKINSLLGTNVSFSKPYELKTTSGYYAYRCQPKNYETHDERGIYEYAILDADSYSNGQYDLYYSLKSNPGLQTKKLNVSVLTKGESTKLEGLDKTYYNIGSPTALAYGGFATDWNDYTDADPYTHESFNTSYSSDLTLDEIIDLERTPQGPYVEHKTEGQRKEFVKFEYDTDYNLVANNIHLQAGEEFLINQGSYQYRYFEDYQCDGTASAKIEQGSAFDEAGLYHRFKVTEEGNYSIKIDNNNAGKIIIDFE